MLLPFLDKDAIEVGCDEAGRGPLAGPVYAAAVILPKDFHHPLLNDSKKLSEKNRYILREVIEACACDYAVVSIAPEEIDELNILKASILAMHRAIAKLSLRPELILVDGNRFYPYMDETEIPHKCIIKGDSKFSNIAAASILAKTYRDDYMREAAKLYPQYDWVKNKGYPTRSHREAIKKWGVKLLPDSGLFDLLEL